MNKKRKMLVNFLISNIQELLPNCWVNEDQNNKKNIILTITKHSKDKIIIIIKNLTENIFVLKFVIDKMNSCNIGQQKEFNDSDLLKYQLLDWIKKELKMQNYMNQSAKKSVKLSKRSSSKIDQQNYAIYFNCVSFCWGSDDTLFSVIDRKNHTNFINLDKMTLYSKEDLIQYKKYHLKQSFGNQQIDHVFRNETEDLIHKFVHDDYEIKEKSNYLLFLVNKKGKKKFKQKEDIQQVVAKQDLDSSHNFYTSPYQRQIIKCWIEQDLIGALNESMSFEFSFFLHIKKFSNVNKIYSNAFYLNWLFKQEQRKEIQLKDLLKFDLLNWLSKKDFYVYGESLLSVFQKSFNFFRFKNIFISLDNQNEVLNNFFVYSEQNLFKDNFLIFLIELFYNFLSLFFTFVKLEEQFQFDLSIDLSFISIKTFLVTLDFQLDYLVSKIIQNSIVKQTLKDVQISLISKNIPFIKNYFSFPSETYKNSSFSYKNAFLFQLNQCQQILQFQQKYFASQNIIQLLQIQKLLSKILIDFQLKLKNAQTQKFICLHEKKSFFTDLPQYFKYFSCSICQVQIKGLVSICFKCFHGGHPSHINQWFKFNDYCHQCIDCNCVFTTHIQSNNQINQFKINSPLKSNPNIILSHSFRDRLYFHASILQHRQKSVFITLPFLFFITKLLFCIFQQLLNNFLQSFLINFVAFFFL